jgi:predicted kinase
MLILLRGLPGSGKSTLAQQFRGFTIVESDHFLPYETKGNRKFKKSELTDAHVQCQAMVDRLLEKGLDVVVANVFSDPAYLQPYLYMGYKYKVQVIVAVVENYHGNSSVHNVPSFVIDGMRNKFKVKI